MEINLEEIVEKAILSKIGIGGNDGINDMVGKYCIVRTYSAGVFFGKIKKKVGKEVIINECRRLYYWKTNGGISLSEVSKTGLDSDNSKVCSATDNHWCEAIELMACTDEAVKSIQGIKDYVN